MTVNSERTELDRCAKAVPVRQPRKLRRGPGIPYYQVKNGNGFWGPNLAMKRAGFQSIRCGPDGPDAWVIAMTWNKRWQQHRTEHGAKTPNADVLPAHHGYVYFLVVGDKVKIGFSTNPFARAQGIKGALSDRIELLVAVRGTFADEKRLHQNLCACRITGEWFVLSARVRRLMMRILSFGKVERAIGVGSEEETAGQELKPEDVK
jgi:hypothetical protein